MFSSMKFDKIIPIIIKRCYSSAVGDSIKITKMGRVTCIGLNMPQNKNSLNLKMLTNLKIAIDTFENDSSSSAGVLYGEQGNFSHGYDQNELTSNVKDIQQIVYDITKDFCKKPIVAAISGFAAGAGFDLALWCDFRIVEDTAILGSYARGFGVPLSDESAARLCTMVGYYRALDWVLTGRMVQAKEALDVGIATRLVACGTALGQAVHLANSLNNMPEACLKTNRATLISVTNQFTSPVFKQYILEEKEKNKKIALEVIIFFFSY
ncbi:hypothetical protein O3M35_009457 [Rhynocoris fuscipes]|uniref:Enoyl-CoA hydratase n=1 Tax=Rhynocoris fuscipes TaxID=488301 RepID=A0AAW1D598_9HEMI